MYCYRWKSVDVIVEVSAHCGVGCGISDTIVIAVEDTLYVSGLLHYEVLQLSSFIGCGYGSVACRGLMCVCMCLFNVKRYRDDNP